MSPRRPSYGLTDLALARPITCLMLLLTMLVTGVVAYLRIPVQLMPAGFSPPFMGVWLPYREATPREVESTIARPVEEMLGTVPKLATLRTHSSAHGCWVFLEFRSEADMTVSYLEVADRMERVRPQLPADQERAYLWKYNPGDEPILWLGISYPADAEDPFHPIATIVQRELERVPGVARVQMEGMFERVVRIDVIPERVRAHHVDLRKLVQDLQGASFTLSSGRVTEGGFEYSLRSLGRFSSIEELAEMPIGPRLRLRDVAHVRYAFSLQERITRINGNPAVTAEVFKESGANAVAVCDRVKEVLARDLAARSELRGYAFHPMFDQGRWIRQSIDNLKSSAIYGGLLAVAVLLVFLRSLRTTLVVALAIPLSILMTLVEMYLRGGSFNLVSMMGLMLGVGMLVDNSIVVVESIHQKRQAGLDLREAARQGAGEVALAIVLATSTTLVVFVPLALMQDDAQFAFFMGELGSPVCWTLVASLFVALVFVPLALARFGSSMKPDPRVLTHIVVGYAAVLRWALRRRLDAFVLIVLLMASTWFPLQRIKRADRVESEPGTIRLGLRMPSHFSLEEASAAVRRVEEALDGNREELQIQDLFVAFRSSHANVMLILRDPDQWMLRMEDLVERVKKILPVIPGVDLRVNWRETEMGSGSVSLRLYGPDSEALADLGEEIGRRLRRVPGVIDVETELERGADEIQVVVDRTLAQKYGVESWAIAGSLQYALRGSRLPDFTAGNQQVPMLVQFGEEELAGLEVLRTIAVHAQDGKEQPVGSLAQFRFMRGLGRISRENRKTVMTIKVFTREDDLTRLEQALRARLGAFALPRGYAWDMGQRLERMEKQAAAFVFAMLLACVFVLLLMGVLFESFLLPLAVIVSIPFAFFGVYWTLWATDTPLDVMASIGVVILVGIVVNNAIVLIDTVNRLRAAGKSREQAIVEAGRTRFRAIWMTTLTTVVGLIPMAVGKSNIVGVPYFPLGRAVMGGLLASTVLSLFVVPLCYTAFDDLREWGMRLWRRVQGAGAPTGRK